MMMGKGLLISLTLLCLNVAIHAQNRLSTLPTVGVVTPLLDNGLGFQVGVNPSFKVNQYVSIESQFSYSYINASAFLTGEDEINNSFYALIGGRLYLASERKTFRPYINAMMGSSHSNKSGKNLGFSTGGFLQIGKTVVGISLESTQNIVFKLGRRF